MSNSTLVIGGGVMVEMSFRSDRSLVMVVWMC